MREIESLIQNSPKLDHKEFVEEACSIAQDLARVNLGEKGANKFESVFSKNVVLQCRRVFKTRYGNEAMPHREEAHQFSLNMKKKQHMKATIFSWLDNWVKKTSFHLPEPTNGTETDATSDSEGEDEEKSKMQLEVDSLHTTNKRKSELENEDAQSEAKKPKTMR